MSEQITSAKRLIIQALTTFGLAQAHLFDPNAAGLTGLQGNCAGCIASRANYCLNGLGDDTQANEQKYGDCLPTADLCFNTTTDANSTASASKSYYDSIMYFGGCSYGGVYHYDTLQPIAMAMHHLHVTSDMGYKTVYAPHAIFDLFMAPSSYQFIMVHDDQDLFQLALSFDGIWDNYDPKLDLTGMNSTARNEIVLQQVRIYFSNKTPSDSWGYPPQLEDLYEPINTPLADYDKAFYVTLVNPTTTSQRVQIMLSENSALTQTIAMIVVAMGFGLTVV